MGEVIRFPGGGREESGKVEGCVPLTENDIRDLYEPLKEGLKRLYPSQVEDVVGVIGFGEKNGNEIMFMGILVWKHYKHLQPIASTFISLFINDKLESISFLEAKNNYWDWRLLIDTYQHKFNTKRMFEDLKRLREEMFGNEDQE